MVKNFNFALIILLFCSVVAFAQIEKGGFVYDSKGNRDPLMPLVDAQGYVVSFASTEGASDLNLEGIVKGQDEGHFAIINSSVFKVGDMIGGYELITIEDTRVILSNNGEELVLELEKEEE